MWTNIRLTAYITLGLTAAATLLAFMGFATFDRETMMFDLEPVHIGWLAGVIAGPLSSALATVALWFGWGKR